MYGAWAFEPDFSSLPNLLPPAVEHKRELEDSDILPKCEYNMNHIKRIWWKPWMVRETFSRCEETAKWFVIIELEACLPDHDHVVMACDDHRYYFDHVRVEHFACNGGVPDPNYTVTRVDRI